jgi:Xaa-Pro dipeptidase
MIPFAKRIKTLQKNMKCDYTILVADAYNSNIFYFTGFPDGLCILVIPKKGRSTFIASNLDVGNVQNKKIKKAVFERSLVYSLKKQVKQHRTVGLDFSGLSVGYLNFIKKVLKPKKILDISHVLFEHRAIKDTYELQQTKKAAQVICSILQSTIKKIPTFRYEYEVKNHLDAEVRRQGYTNSFDTIVASGKNASNPHYAASKDVLRRGFLVIDCGVKVNGYCSDITRTVFLGTPTKEEFKLYEKVLAVQNKCIELTKQNKPINLADELAQEVLGKAFIHALGHGTGLDVHELPRVSSHNKQVLQNNVCFTIEPGVYYPGKLGIRIEDDLIKTNNKVQVITPLTKKLIIFNNKIYK